MLKYVNCSERGIDVGYVIYDTETGRVLMRRDSYNVGAANLEDAKKMFKILEQHWN